MKAKRLSVLENNRKALSTIVSTLLILLLVFVAVGILWAVVRSFVQAGSEQVSLGKFTLDLKMNSVILNSTGNTVSVRVVRNSGAGEFTGLRFVLDDGDITEVLEVRNVAMNEYDENTFDLVPTAVNVGNIQTIELAPIFTLSSGKELNGDIKDTWYNSQ